MLAIGQAVPAFNLVNQRGEFISSAALKGHRYVLYFYPKDDTPGCTKEACGFRDALPAFNAKTTRIFGISADDQRAHAKFVDKYGLNFDLLADSERKLIEAMGVWVEKSMYGKKYMGILRATFVINAAGNIEKSWDKVDTATHANDVLSYLQDGASTSVAPAKSGAKKPIAKTVSRAAKPADSKTAKPKPAAKAVTKTAALKKPLAKKAVKAVAKKTTAKTTGAKASGKTKTR